MKPKNRVWRVRVLKCVEGWEEVHAPTKKEAEAQVLARQGVKELRGVTVLAEQRANQPLPGVEDEETSGDS